MMLLSATPRARPSHHEFARYVAIAAMVFVEVMLIGCQVPGEGDVFSASTYTNLCPAPRSEDEEVLIHVNGDASPCKRFETDYLPQVVACENYFGSFESHKAQAIAARTYAYYMLMYPEEFSNIPAGTINGNQSSQAFHCDLVPTAEIIDAVKQTKDEVLAFVDTTVDGISGYYPVVTFFVDGDVPGPTDSCLSQTRFVGSPHCVAPASDAEQRQCWVSHYAEYDGQLRIPSAIGEPSNVANFGCLSQNEANCLASREGKNYKDILKAFYGPNTVVKQLRDLANYPQIRPYAGVPSSSGSGRDETFPVSMQDNTQSPQSQSPSSAFVGVTLISKSPADGGYAAVNMIGHKVIWTLCVACGDGNTCVDPMNIYTRIEPKSFPAEVSMMGGSIALVPGVCGANHAGVEAILEFETAGALPTGEVAVQLTADIMINGVLSYPVSHQFKLF